MKFTKGQIDRLGARIREEMGEVQDTTLDELQIYRTSHKESIADIFKILCELSREVNLNSIVTYRIKRFESIISKLHRYPEMRFSRMWDIGGCRCIVKDDNDLHNLKERIEKRLIIKKINNYLDEPQEEGYRSLHLFASLPGDETIIELQLRSEQDHSWATLVEITDLLYDAKLKEFGKNKELLRFHYLLSKKNDLTISDKKEIVEILIKYEYFEKLSETFSRNYLQVRLKWLSIENKTSHKFFLIETKKDEVPKIHSFVRFAEAEENYFALYKSSQNSNVVLTHLPSPNYRKISIAYSNYILTFHTFLDDCYDMIESLVIESLTHKHYLKFYKYFKIYNSVIYEHIYNLSSEIKALKNPSLTKDYQKNSRKKIEEWRNDINQQISKRNKNRISTQSIFSELIPKTGFRRLVVLTLAQLAYSPYKKKFKKIVERAKS